MNWMLFYLLLHTKKRRDAGVVDRGGLENRCTFTGTQGSNPCLSAKIYFPKPLSSLI